MVRAHVKQTPEEKKEIQKTKAPSKKKSSETGSWPCKINGCNKVFAREADLKRHQRTTKSHSIPSFACPQCDATFTRTDALRRHQKSRHNGVVIDTSQTGKDKPETDTGADSPTSKSSSHAGTPDKEADEPVKPASKKTSKVETSPKGPSSYYRQHTMHPSYGATRPSLPPPPPPPPMLYDPHYPPPIAMPTSAARLHPWSPVPPPWHPPSAPASPRMTAVVPAPVSTEGSPAASQTSPSPPAPAPLPPAGAMYRVPTPYYPYYPPPMYHYPPPEYLAHYGMMHPGIPMPPYMPAMPGPPPPGVPQPAASSPRPNTETETEDDGDKRTEDGVSVPEVPDTAIDPSLASTNEVRASSAHIVEGATAKKGQDKATIEAAKVAVEVLLKYQSERDKSVTTTSNVVESPKASVAQLDPGPDSPAPPSRDVSTSTLIAGHATGADSSQSTATDELPMLNADELLTQESLASPPPPA